MDLDDNISLQFVATIGLCCLAVVWISFLIQQPGFPLVDHLRTSTASPDAWASLFGVLLFNLSLMSALPSWDNEKRRDVSELQALVLSMGFVATLYTLIGVVGALAFADFGSSGNLFSKLNASGSFVAQSTVSVYPVLQNLTSIPVFCIFMKYNMMQLGWFNRSGATMVAFLVPWLLSVPLYGGRGFEWVAELGGLVFSTAVNIIIPVALFVLARRRQRPPQDTGAAAGVAASMTALAPARQCQQDARRLSRWTPSED